LILGALLAAPCAVVHSHGVAGADSAYLQSVQGVQAFPLMYLGAKHMITGYDHLLYLAGVVFFLYRFRDVALYVTLFAVGHSVTLLAGVLSGIHTSPYLIDAIIGLSVVYKALENIGAFRRLGIRIDPRLSVTVFGLAHGLGLATKLLEVGLSPDGAVGNLLAFNAGVELGQLAALAMILVALQVWRRSGSFQSRAYIANVVVMGAGFVIFGHQVTGLLVHML
jgi:hypothetical protein